MTSEDLIPRIYLREFFFYPQCIYGEAGKAGSIEKGRKLSNIFYLLPHFDRMGKEYLWDITAQVCSQI